MKLIYQDFCVLLSPCLSSGCIAGNCILFYVEELNTVRYSVLMEEIQTSIEWLLTLHMYCIPAALSQLFIHHMLLHERKIDHLLVHYLQLVVGTIILSEGDVNPLFHETTAADSWLLHGMERVPCWNLLPHIKVMCLLCMQMGTKVKFKAFFLRYNAEFKALVD